MDEHAAAKPTTAPAPERPSALAESEPAAALGALAGAGGAAALAAAVGRSPRAALALQQASGNRAVSRLVAARAPRRVLQRAILVVHGAADSDEERKATEACLSILATRKAGGRPQAADAPRGAVWVLDFKGAERGRPPAGPPSGFLAGDRTLYLLAHGGGLKQRTVGGFNAERMAGLLGHYFDDEAFTGTIKLVSCMSATNKIAIAPGRAVAVTPYVLELARMLEPSEDDESPFRPASVQGIVGIAWVDESGRMTSIDPAAYARELAKNEAAVDAAFAELDPAARGRAIQGLFPGAEISVGKGVKRRVAIEYPPTV